MVAGPRDSLLRTRNQIAPRRGHDLTTTKPNTMKDLRHEWNELLEMLEQHIADKRITPMEDAILTKAEAVEAELSKLESNDGNDVIMGVNFSSSMDMLDDLFRTIQKNPVQ